MSSGSSRIKTPGLGITSSGCFDRRGIGTSPIPNQDLCGILPLARESGNISSHSYRFEIESFSQHLRLGALSIAYNEAHAFSLQTLHFTAHADDIFGREARAIILVENAPCVHCIWRVHVNEVSRLCVLQRSLEITSQQSHSPQCLRTGPQRLRIRQSSRSAGSIRHIEFTLPVGPVQAIKAKPVEIDEASGPLWWGKVTRPKGPHSQILTLGTPEALQL